MPPKKEPSFEDSLKRLEAIAREIEEGRIGLEESITRYEEGMTLVQECRRILTQAEQKIRTLQPSADGDLEAKPLDAGDDADEAQDADG
jgi:exodeoxyribonuclease VII small subunit